MNPVYLSRVTLTLGLALICLPATLKAEQRRPFRKAITLPTRTQPTAQQQTPAQTPPAPTNSAAQDDSRGKLPREWEEMPIKPAFTLTEGHLGIGTPPGQEDNRPRWAFARLYRWVTQDGVRKAFRITSLDDLKGHVQITSSRAALSFVRLLTSERTGSKLESPRLRVLPPGPVDPQEIGKIEVISADALDSDFWYGDEEPLRKFKRNPKARSPEEGILPPDVAKKHNLPKATCVAVGTGFRVTRVLLVGYQNSHEKLRLFLVQEGVGSDGTYTLEKATPLPTAIVQALDLRFPILF